MSSDSGVDPSFLERLRMPPGDEIDEIENDNSTPLPGPFAKHEAIQKWLSRLYTIRKEILNQE
jgi:hypothetical protein